MEHHLLKWTSIVVAKIFGKRYNDEGKEDFLIHCKGLQMVDFNHPSLSLGAEDMEVLENCYQFPVQKFC